MTFQQLKYLLEVAQAGSVSQAAKNLFVSSSSITIAVRKLEKELGYELFFRNTQGLVPTQRGMQILAHAERICQSYDQLYEVSQEPTRTIRINFNGNTIVSRVIAQIITENRDRRELRFETTSYSMDIVMRKLQNNELDISLTTMMQIALGFWQNKTARAGLHLELMKTIPACIQVGPGHRLYGADRVHPQDLRSEVLIDNPHHPLTASPMFSGTIYTSPAQTLSIAHLTVQEELLLQGMGYRIAMLPSPVDWQNTLLRSIPLDGVNYCICALTNPQTPRPPEISRLLQILKKELDIAYPEEIATDE